MTATRLTIRLVLLSAVSVGHVHGQQTASAAVVFRNANIVEVQTGHTRPGMTVVVRGGRIVTVAPADEAEVPPAAHVIDASGKYLLPGLIDTHVHLGLAWDYARPDTVAQLGWILAGGVTTVRDAHPMGHRSSLLALQRAAQAGQILSPRIYISELPDSSTLAELKTEDVGTAIERLRLQGVHGIKVMHQGRARTLEIIHAARRAGLPVYGHPSTILMHRGPGQEHFAMEAVRNGLSGIMHMAWLDLPDRTAGPIHLQPKLLASVPRQESEVIERWHSPDVRDTDALIDTMVARGAWLEPTLTVLYHDSRAFAGQCADQHDVKTVQRRFPTWSGVEPATLGAADREIVLAACAHINAFVRRFYEAGGTVIAGSDYLAFPPYGVAEEVQLLVRAGLSPVAAIQAATINAARALGWDDEIGSIEPGKRADLILLDANPLENIRNLGRRVAVVANGRVVNHSEIEALLQP